MPKSIPDGNQPENENTSDRLARDLSDLQKEIRQDFDQRIIDLSSLMGKFRALLINDSRARHSANDAENSSEKADSQVPILTNKVEPTVEQPAIRRALPEGYQRARFETGLYHLNSQLQRFRLELDQELEFRQQPLHVHFRHQSDLAKILQQIALNMQQQCKR